MLRLISPKATIVTEVSVEVIAVTGGQDVVKLVISGGKALINHSSASVKGETIVNTQ